MSEMVERVARVLSIADGNHPEACSNDEDEIPAWTLYLDDARAAIEAMREPTVEMNNAYGSDLEQSYQYWTHMVDAALK